MRTFISNDDIKARIRSLARRILPKLQDKDVLVLALLKGAAFFCSDLMQELNMEDYELEFIKARSYEGEESTGDIQIGEFPDVSQKTILLLDDIIDTGLTLSTLARKLREAGAKEILTAVLLSKPSRRVIPFTPDFVGFEIPDRFVLGYGMDLDEKFRCMRDIKVKD